MVKKKKKKTNKSELKASSHAWGRVHQPCDGSEAKANQNDDPPPHWIKVSLVPRGVIDHAHPGIP